MKIFQVYIVTVQGRMLKFFYYSFQLRQYTVGESQDIQPRRQVTLDPEQQDYFNFQCDCGHCPSTLFAAFDEVY